MKLLVTGGAGFIGSNLVESLVEDGEEVVVLDSLHTGSLENLSGVRNRVRVVVSRCSEVLGLEGLEHLDGVYHLGIPSSSPMYKENRLLVGDSVNEFIKILELVRREDCKLVFASSSSIYNGNPTPWREDMPIYVKDFYTEARYTMERLASLYHDFYGIKAVGLRFFSVYGPKEEYKGRYANLVSQFLWCMLRGEKPIIFGDGNQTRDFIYVDDVVKACKLAMKSGVEQGVFNVGTGKSYSLNQLVKILKEMLKVDLEPEYVENPIKNYVYHTLADVSKAKQMLGFQARYSLEEGIKKILSLNKKGGR
ncbi:MAG: nucleoside-diphosphate sugar epimerase [Methanobacteriota archaeon]|nr:MAG: nucleoside-diphosphate sugar epimerase [Euryarchaeota archaeon]